ncbi:uncharacterized protein trdc [Anableps anableps]
MFSVALILLLTAGSCVLSIDLIQPESKVVQPGQSLTIICRPSGYSLTDSYATDGPSVTPSLFVLSPLQTPGYPLKTADELGPDVCLVTDFRPKGGDVVLNVKDGQVNVSTDNAVLSKNNTYHFVAFSNETIYSCGINGMIGNNEADDECRSIYPEKAKLNFYLLLMNGVRVVFTKALAFSTVLTIRGLLF